MIAYAQQNIQSRQMQERVRALCADVHQLPFSDQSIDLVISRGSVFFWEDLRQAFEEIYRVLKPGGTTFIGGGFGTDELKQEIEKKMAQKDEEWAAKSKKRIESFSSSNYKEILNGLNIPHEIIRDNGFWIIIRREAQ
jgi:ubiquinone/menaquinone biosynthesis C-methylase UbiE